MRKGSKVWVVVDIGCLECGEVSNLVGIFPCKDEASLAASSGDYFSTGQHKLEIFETVSP